MRIELERMMIENAGLITAYCRILREDGTLVRRLAVQGKDEAAVADEARRKYAAVVVADGHEALREKVRLAIEEINTGAAGRGKT